MPPKLRRGQLQRNESNPLEKFWLSYGINSRIFVYDRIKNDTSLRKPWRQNTFLSRHDRCPWKVAPAQHGDL